MSMEDRFTKESRMRTALPTPTPETLHFWEGCRAGELRLQRCTPCGHIYFPPRAFCPQCSSRDVGVVVASGRGTLYSYIINHRPRPDMGTEPHSIAVVQLAEGPRMMSNIVHCPQTPDALVLDMPLRVIFEKQNDEIALPLFEPVTDRVHT
jgi:uncharacterized OB-fold protein